MFSLMSDQHHVYTIQDPLTGRTVYVGITDNIPQRMLAHIAKARSGNGGAAYRSFFMSFAAQPNLLVPRTVYSGERKDAEAVESAVIRLATEAGANLLNVIYHKQPATRAHADHCAITAMYYGLFGPCPKDYSAEEIENMRDAAFQWGWMLDTWINSGVIPTREHIDRLNKAREMKCGSTSTSEKQNATNTENT